MQIECAKLGTDSGVNTKFMSELSASEYVKQAGLNSLTQLSDMCGYSTEQLRTIYNNKPIRFYMFVQAALVEVHHVSISSIIKDIQRERLSK